MNGNHNVSILVEKFKNFLQTPETALAAAQDEFYDLVVLSIFFKFGIDVLQNSPDQLDNGNDGCSKSQRTGVIPQSAPER